MNLTKTPVFLHYFSKFMGILLFVLKHMYISLLLKMINGFSWPAKIMVSPFKKEEQAIASVALGKFKPWLQGYSALPGSSCWSSCNIPSDQYTITTTRAGERGNLVMRFVGNLTMICREILTFDIKKYRPCLLMCPQNGIKHKAAITVLNQCLLLL